MVFFRRPSHQRVMTCCSRTGGCRAPPTEMRFEFILEDSDGCAINTAESASLPAARALPRPGRCGDLGITHEAGCRFILMDRSVSVRVFHSGLLEQQPQLISLIRVCSTRSASEYSSSVAYSASNARTRIGARRQGRSLRLRLI